jgi:small nuclear ribonucleoprotein (snRNP)-like protein
MGVDEFGAPDMSDQERPLSGIEEYLGQQVVVDTCSNYIILGTLSRIDHDYLTLENVDVHDTSDADSTKDHYIMESHKLGIRTNRRGAKVRIAEILSVSLLRDVEIY